MFANARAGGKMDAVLSQHIVRVMIKSMLPSITHFNFECCDAIVMHERPMRSCRRSISQQWVGRT